VRVVDSGSARGGRVADAERRGRWLDCERLPDHLDRLTRAAYALCGSREDSDDLVQETYAQVLRRPRWLRHGGELPYLMRVLRNVWYGMLTARARRPEVPTELEQVELAADPGADPDLLLDARAAYAAIAGLSAPLRETIVAVDVLGLSYREAARALRTREPVQRAPQNRGSHARRSVVGDTPAVDGVDVRAAVGVADGALTTRRAPPGAAGEPSRATTRSCRPAWRVQPCNAAERSGSEHG